jgi:uncharacterized protein YggE
MTRHLPTHQLLPAAALAALFLAADARAQGAGPTQTLQPVVVTTGEAVIHQAPDRAFVTIAAESRATSPQQAQRQTAEAMSAVQARLKEAGIAAEAVQTRAVELRPEFDYVNGKQVPRGYLARNSIEVRVDAIERLGATLDLAVGSGATSITGVRFDLKNRDAVERDALRRAVADARARAEAAAAGAGLTIDRVIRIEEQRSVHVPPPMPMTMSRAVQVAEPATPIAPGEIEVRAMVTLTAALSNR